MNDAIWRNIRALYIITILLSISIFIVSLTGCSSIKLVPTSTSASQAAQPVTPDPETNDFLKQFGETVSWNDGVSVSVSQPASFTPSVSAMGGGENNLVFEMVLTNNSAEPVEPMSVFATASSGGQEARMVADVGNEVGQIGASPMTKVLPGQTVKWLIGFSVADPASINVEVRYSFLNDSAIFTNIPF